jgi:hypothetical protein
MLLPDLAPWSCVYSQRYYVSRADAPQTRHLSTLLQRSLFRPLGRVRYDIVGQDRVFEQLFTVLNQHSRTLSVSPLVLLLCGAFVSVVYQMSQISTPYRAQWPWEEFPGAEMYVCSPVYVFA